MSDEVPTLYEWAGGTPAFQRLTSAFYARVLQDDLLEPVFRGMDEEHPRHVATWLAEVFGGPPRYTEEHGGYPHMLSKHRGLALTEPMRRRWVALICDRRVARITTVGPAQSSAATTPQPSPSRVLSRTKNASENASATPAKASSTPSHWRGASRWRGGRAPEAEVNEHQLEGARTDAAPASAPTRTPGAWR